jgi:YVTN family beta-propeller protein
MVMAILPASHAAAEPAPLQREGTITLGDVKGRIDHMAVDLARQRLFVAELGNDTVSVIDLRERKVLRRIDGLSEPQGVGYMPSADTLYVANARDGSVHLFRDADLARLGKIDLGNDADNIRVDIEKNQVLIGYGEGAIAIIDPTTARKIADFPAKSHPESFQISASTNQIFVNLPRRDAVAVFDRGTGQPHATWPTRRASGNYAMALDDAGQRVFVAFRDPARIRVLAMRDGATVAEHDTCGDSDDVFFDAKRKRLYVICGAGFVDVFDGSRDDYARLARLPTMSGARTGLFIPELDLLAVAARASGAAPAALWLYRAVP